MELGMALASIYMKKRPPNTVISLLNIASLVFLSMLKREKKLL